MNGSKAGGGGTYQVTYCNAMCKDRLGWMVQRPGEQKYWRRRQSPNKDSAHSPARERARLDCIRLRLSRFAASAGPPGSAVVRKATGKPLLCESSLQTPADRLLSTSYAKESIAICARYPPHFAALSALSFRPAGLVSSLISL